MVHLEFSFHHLKVPVIILTNFYIASNKKKGVFLITFEIQ